jgi:dephospho-CoA kinase
MGYALPRAVRPLAVSGAPHRWVLGLTGGIASGKSTVAALFANAGADVIDLDEVAREVVAPGSALLQTVFQRFGSNLRLPDGSLDRRALRSVVFADAAKRLELEALLHPAMIERAGQRIAESQAAYQIVVNPLLAEWGARARYDRVLLVDAHPEQQRRRLAARDGSNAQEIEAMLAAQTSREKRQAVADDVIDNSGDATALAAEVAKLHQRYLGLASASSTIAR